MRKRMPCAVCGNLSGSFLFRDKVFGVPICSKKCEHEYLKNLSTGTTEHTNAVQYLDHRIGEFRRRNRMCWGFAGVGIILVVFSVLIPDVNIFIAGNVMAASGALATRHYEDTVSKLTTVRKRLAI